MRFFKWNWYKFMNQWFSAEKQLKKKIGIIFDIDLLKKNPFMSQSLQSQNQGYCQICYTKFNSSGDRSRADSLSCGHQFCKEDWEEYLKQRVNDGFQSVYSKCPQHMCNVVVPHSMFLKYLKGEDLKTYLKWYCKAYTDDNKNVRWCPYQGCDYCIEYRDSGKPYIDCKCGNSFCFRCGQESHRPCDCSVTDLWKSKNSAESENITWIMANTKQCPECRKPIEKNQGCNHMNCKMCSYEFCWLCLGKWSDHGQKTGGYYACNKYDELKKQGDDKIAKEENKRAQAKNELDRYMFYFERFNNHDKAEKHARNLKPVIKVKIDLLQQIKKYPLAELEFLDEAINEVVKCRQVLKYTYVFGFYLTNQKELNLFQFAQEDLEKNCDYLHELIEKPLDPFLDSNVVDRSSFYHYKGQLVNYTQVTKKVRLFVCLIVSLQFYESLLEGIEKGLTNI